MLCRDLVMEYNFLKPKLVEFVTIIYLNKKERLELKVSSKK
jgi:hypothetical protein